MINTALKHAHHERSGLANSTRLQRLLSVILTTFPRNLSATAFRSDIAFVAILIVRLSALYVTGMARCSGRTLN